MSDMDRRVHAHPILDDLREPDTYIWYHDTKIPAVTGEPVAAALMASGIRVMRHTVRTGQPRGIFCAIGRCTDCVMVVDGVPNVRTCMTPLVEGMKVETQYGVTDIPFDDVDGKEGGAA